jgi:acetoin:2,6-dichlorophenolindophenol oxidoreductase subunit alpha
MALSKEDLKKMLYWMVLDRRFEERMMVLHRAGRIRGHLHPGLGQEATNVGVGYGLRKEDCLTLSHRGKTPELIKGWSMKDMIAGRMCRKEAFGGGRLPGGSHMYGDLSKGIIPSPGIIGSIIPVATGVGLALKMKKSGGVAVCLFGDGASNRGDFHEGINLAAALRIPVLFVLINNQWAISVPLGRATCGLSSLSVRAVAYGIPGVTVDGNDVREVYEKTSQALERARAGDGPTLLECMVHRWTGHSMTDPDSYRTDAERKAGEEKDPVARFKRELIDESVVTEEGYRAIEEQVRKEIGEAVQFAENECTPAPDPSDILRGVYANQ